MASTQPSAPPPSYGYDQGDRPPQYESLHKNAGIVAFIEFHGWLKVFLLLCWF